jgi:hypothetical protein
MVNSKAGLEALQAYLAHEVELAREIRELAKTRFEPLTKLGGINLLTAGQVAAILGPGDRFKSHA